MTLSIALSCRVDDESGLLNAELLQDAAEKVTRLVHCCGGLGRNVGDGGSLNLAPAYDGE